MPRRRDSSGSLDFGVETPPVGEKKATAQVDRKPGQCGTCRMFMPREFWSGHGSIPEPVHCGGSTIAWRGMHLNAIHHGRVKHDNCWKCGGDLGCDQCAGRLDNVLCERCAAWGTQEALAAHGPISNQGALVRKRRGRRAPELPEYPEAFQYHYYRENRNVPEDMGRWQEIRAEIKSMPDPAPYDWDDTVKGT